MKVKLWSRLRLKHKWIRHIWIWYICKFHKERTVKAFSKILEDKEN